MGFSVICTMSKNGAIGVTNNGVYGVPWPQLDGNLTWFNTITTSVIPIVAIYAMITNSPSSRDIWHTEGNALIMGRRTWESLGSKLLPYRHSIILNAGNNNEQSSYDGAAVCDSLDEALHMASTVFCAHKTFVIGGARLYAEALRHPGCERLYLTLVDAVYPEADKHWPYHEEMQYEQGIFEYAIPYGSLTERCGITMRRWHRTLCSPWVVEPAKPRYRFSVWERM